MATKALTLGVQRPVFDHPVVKKAPRNSRSWRSLLLKQDAHAIWDKLAALVRNVLPGDNIDPDRLTQDLFIHLLATERFRFYLEEEYTDDQIKRDILSLIRK